MDSQELYEQLKLIERNSGQIELAIQQMKGTIVKLVDENSSLKMENSHLREKLDTLDKSQVDIEEVHVKTYGKSNLEKLYDSGVHVCHSFYGARRNESCLLCESLLSQVDDK